MDSLLAKLISPLTGYTHWLHTRWPAGTVEHLPEVGPDGATNLRGVRIVGDLSGVPLLKFSADTGARAVQAMLAEPDFKQDGGTGSDTLDLAILGGGVSGISGGAGSEAGRAEFPGFRGGGTLHHHRQFPTRPKPIYAYPKDMVPAGRMQFHADVKEALLDRIADASATRRASR